jgi:hypothetical protein
VFPNYEFTPEPYDEPGLAYTYYDDWESHILLDDADDGTTFKYAVNDNFTHDNVPDGGGPLNFMLALAHGSSFYKHLATQMKKMR